MKHKILQGQTCTCEDGSRPFIASWSFEIWRTIARKHEEGIGAFTSHWFTKIQLTSKAWTVLLQTCQKSLHSKHTHTHRQLSMNHNNTDYYYEWLEPPYLQWSQWSKNSITSINHFKSYSWDLNTYIRNSKHNQIASPQKCNAQYYVRAK